MALNPNVPLGWKKDWREDGETRGLPFVFPPAGSEEMASRHFVQLSPCRQKLSFAGQNCGDNAQIWNCVSASHVAPNDSDILGEGR